MRSAVTLPLLIAAWAMTPDYDASGIPIVPLSPALAVALGATCLLGWRALPALALALAWIAVGGWPADHAGTAAWNAPLLWAQAAFGGLLLRRSSRIDDLALDSTGSLQRLAATAISCGAIGMLVTLGIALLDSNTARPYTVAAVRGLCDAGSVMVLLPIALAIAAPPRARWRSRWRSVALPLLALSAVLWLVFARVDARDRQHAEARFERDADAMAAHARLLIGADGGTTAGAGAPAASGNCASSATAPCPGPDLPMPADRLATTLLAARTDALRLCIFHEDARSEPRRLQGPLGCDTAAVSALVFRRDAVLERSGHRWLMRIEQPVQTPGGVWLFAMPAVACGALLSWLLLSMSSRLLRIQDDARLQGDELQWRATRQLDAVMGVVPAGLALLAPDGRILRANEMLATLVQRPMTELLHQPITELLSDEHSSSATGLADLLRDTGQGPSHRDMTLHVSDGRRIGVRVGFRVERDPDGRVATAACAVHLASPG
jgi:PAS domain-containing protein